jgi:hypothetical protein
MNHEHRADAGSALEKQVELLLQRKKPPESGDWIQDFIRPVSDPNAFEEVIRLGREIREADRH